MGWEKQHTVNLGMKALEAMQRSWISSCVFREFIEDFMPGTDSVNEDEEMIEMDTEDNNDNTC